MNKISIETVEEYSDKEALEKVVRLINSAKRAIEQKGYNFKPNIEVVTTKCGHRLAGFVSEDGKYVKSLTLKIWEL